MEKVDKYFSELDFIQSFRKQLKNKDYDSTTIVALQTADLLLKIIKSKQYNNLDELLNIIKTVGKMFISVDLMQFSVGNIVKRILHFIHQEKQKVINNNDRRITIMTINSLLSLTNFKDERDKDKTKGNDRLTIDINQLTTTNKRAPMLEAAVDNIISDIEDLIATVECTSSEINKQSDEHIMDNDIILTSNYSGQLSEFLIEASKTKTFHVIVAESYPSMSGLVMAKKLVKEGVKTTVIEDCALFSVIPRVNKVIIGTRAVMANGGLISYNGVYNICLAAQTYSIPILVVSGVFKLTPMHPFDHETFNEQLSPDKIYDCKYNGSISNLKFNSPAYDYIPPEFITLFITDAGSQNPSYIYRLFNDYFSQQDYFL